MRARNPATMRRPAARTPILGLFLSLALGSALPALEMTGLDLALGHNDDNRLTSPIFDTEGLPAISVGDIAWERDPQRYLVYRMSSSLLSKAPKYKKPRYRLVDDTDLGQLLAEALRSESRAMGFQAGKGGAGEWQVTGTLHDLVVEIRNSGGGFGPMLFFGFMDLELTVQGQGASHNGRYRFYDMSHIYNAGFGAQDEAKEALARFLVETAQEVVTRLNREVFSAPPMPEFSRLLNGLNSDSSNWEMALLRAGLSGQEDLVPELLQMLQREKADEDRVLILNALANIGSAKAHAAMAERYSDEDEDCRLHILKAMAYAGQEEGLAFIDSQGRRDSDLPARVLAHRASGKL